jgi:SAM-dependent methyltransferase
MATIWQHITQKSVGFYKREWFADPARSRGRVLDLPAGIGPDARALLDLGYDVVPADLVPEWVDAAILDGRKCVPVDMEAPLPFEDASFDYVLNSEGIEHVDGQLRFLKECNRILQPGGTLVLTTPNLLSLRARVAFMLTGNRAFKSFVDEVTSVWGYDGRRVYHGHAFLVNYYQLRYMLWHAGFRIVDVVGTRYSVTSMLFAPLVPFVRLFTGRAEARAARKHDRGEIYREIDRDVYSVAMLLSANLFLVAESIPPEERIEPAKTL